jgi:hypothetical protein
LICCSTTAVIPVPLLCCHRARKNGAPVGMTKDGIDLLFDDGSRPVPLLCCHLDRSGEISRRQARLFPHGGHE